MRYDEQHDNGNNTDNEGAIMNICYMTEDVYVQLKDNIIKSTYHTALMY